MSFRSRILSRNTLPRANFAQNLAFEVRDGNVVVVELSLSTIERERRLYDDVKPSVIADAGLPFQEFKPSPDGSRNSQERDLDADCSVVSQILVEKGYDLDKPMKGQKVNQSKQKQSQPSEQPKVEPSISENNE